MRTLFRWGTASRHDPPEQMAAPSVSRPFRRWGWHGHVCPPQECRNMPAVLRIDGDADAGLDHDTMSFLYKRLFQGHEQLVRDPRGAHGGGRRPHP